MFQLWNSNRRFALTGWSDFSKLGVAKADLNQRGGRFPARFFASPDPQSTEPTLAGEKGST